MKISENLIKKLQDGGQVPLQVCTAQSISLSN